MMCHSPTAGVAGPREAVVQDRERLREFLRDHLDAARLGIRSILPGLDREPFFLVAATGLGKTVAVPLHLLIETRWFQQGPGQILVVEPTIPICRNEARHLTELFTGKYPRTPSPFGALTGSGKDNPDAPVLFITTGILEQVVRGEHLRPERVRIVIDEAHRVLGSSAGAELAIAIARNRGITVDYMSATIDTRGVDELLGVRVIRADAQRFPILKASAGRAIDDCISEVVDDCLFSGGQRFLPKVTDLRDAAARAEAERVLLHLRSPSSFVDPADGVRYPGLLERPQGLLVVVTSHSGARSDTRRVSEAVEGRLGERGLVVLPFASEIARDEVRVRAFQDRLARVEAENGRYVIVSTNVIEMGVTFPSLDYVVTVDTELAGEEGRLRRAALGVNAFYQRIGRVGRKRPGAAIVTTEAGGAEWSRWSAEQLATRLRYEPIRFATARGEVRPLAVETYVMRATDAQVPLALRDLDLPSRPQDDENLIGAIITERKAMRSAGLANNDRLTSHGEQFRGIGVVSSIAHGTLLAKLKDHPGSLAIVAAVAGASESVPLADLVGRSVRLDLGTLDEVEIVPAAWLTKPASEVHAALSRIREFDAASIAGAGVAEGGISAVGVALTAGLRPAPLSPATTPTLYLELRRAAIRLDPDSELLSVYAILRHFYNEFENASRDEETFEEEARRHAREDGCRRLGVLPGPLGLVRRRLRDVLRKAKIKLPRERIPERPIPASILAAGRSRGIPEERLMAGWKRLSGERFVEHLPSISDADRQAFLKAVSEVRAFERVPLRADEDGWRGDVAGPKGRREVRLDPARTSIRFHGSGGTVVGLIATRERAGVDEHVLAHVTRVGGI